MSTAGSVSGGVNHHNSTAFSFAVQAIRGRWFMVYGSSLIMAVSGCTYMFGAYSSDIKSSLGYTQTTLNLLSFFKDLGSNFGLPAGLLMEVTPPWVVLAIGAGLNFFGYFMMWLAVTGKIAKPAVWQMCLYICVGTNSMSFSNTGALIPCMKNFPESRGLTMGLLKGLVGLTSAIMTQLYQALYFQDSKSLILFVGWLPTAIYFVFIRTFRYITPASDPKNVNVFYQFLYMSLALAGFLLATIVLQNNFNFSHNEYIASAVVVFTLLFILPLYTTFKQEHILWNKPKLIQYDIVQETNVVVSETPERKTESESADGCFENIFRPPKRGEDHTILQALFSLDMLILFITSLVGIGGTLVGINNLGQIGSSLGYSSKGITTCVSLVSIWNYLGRVVAGFLSEYFLTKYKLPRPLMFTFVLFLSCIGHLMISFGMFNALYVASAILGFCCGAQYSLILVILSEIFGLKYYSTISNIGVLACPIGNYIFSVNVIGDLYDKEASRQLAALGLKRKPGEELVCNGVKCFQMAFIIVTMMNVVAVFVSLVLVVRTWKFYKSDIYKKFREVGENNTMTVSDRMSRNGGASAAKGEEG